MMEAEPENVDPIMLDEKRVVVVSVYFMNWATLCSALSCSALPSFALLSSASRKASKQSMDGWMGSTRDKLHLHLQFQYTNSFHHNSSPDHLKHPLLSNSRVRVILWVML